MNEAGRAGPSDLAREQRDPGRFDHGGAQTGTTHRRFGPPTQVATVDLPHLRSLGARIVNLAGEVDDAFAKAFQEGAEDGLQDAYA